MIAIRGINSAIAQALITEELDRLDGAQFFAVERGDRPPLAGFDRYLFCQGLLYDKRAADQTNDEIAASIKVNALDVISSCEYIFANNADARICVLGSESAFAGSFDETYAMAKRALHHYVEHKRLMLPGQQLVAVAPSIISDAGMTLRRKDQQELERRRLSHPMGRFATAREVAALIYFLLYGEGSYISGTVIRMTGGLT